MKIYSNKIYYEYNRSEIKDNCDTFIINGIKHVRYFINMNNRYKIEGGEIIFDEKYIMNVTNDKFNDYEDKFLVLNIYGEYFTFFDFGTCIIEKIEDKFASYYKNYTINEWLIKDILE